MDYNSGFVLLYFTAHYIYTVNFRVKWRSKCALSHHRMGRYAYHNTKKQNSLSQSTKCYYFHVLFPLYTAMKSVHTKSVLQCSLAKRQTDPPHTDGMRIN